MWQNRVHKGERKMSFTEKIDVLDLIINTLNEHEQKLDELTERLEVIIETVTPLLEALR